MRVLFLKPRIALTEKGNMFPPLNLLYLATILKKKGIEVKILDQQAKRIKQEQMMNIIRNFKPEVVCVGSMTPEIFSAYNDIDVIKKNFPEIRIILGGTHISSVTERTMEENPNVDIGVIGEGENVIYPLIKAIEEKKSLKGIKGVAYRNKKEIMINPRTELVKDLNKLPFPDYSLVDINDYAYRQRGWDNRRFMSMITSRGCPFQCTFCSHGVFGRTLRMHDAEYIVKHIELLYNEYGIRGIGFVDDTFTINKQRVLEFCDLMIKKKLDVIWYCFANVKTVDKEMLTAMKRAGCVKISYGVESGDEEIQKKIKKYLDLNQVKEVFDMTNRIGIETLAFFMIGHPGETKETIRKSKEFAKKLKPDFVNVSILCPLPGSDIYDQFKETLPKDWSRYQMTPFVKQPVLQLGELSLNELQKELKKFYRDFYFRPSYILSRILKVRKFEDLLFYIRKVLAVSKDWF